MIIIRPKFVLVLMTMIISNIIVAQSNRSFDLNKGGTEQKDYFTVVPYENIKGKILISAEINGKKFRFIFDTGASNIISKSVYNEFSFKTLCRLPTKDGNGKVDSATIVSLDNLLINNILFQNIPTLVATDSNLILNCLKVDGFIGSNMLRNSIIRFSSKDRTITITDSEKKLGLKPKESTLLRLTPNQSLPFVLMKLKNDDTENEEVLFDSGLDELYSISLNNYYKIQKKNIFKVLSKSIGSNSISVNGDPSENEIIRLRVPEIFINKTKFSNITAQSNQGALSGLGSEIFNYGIITLDYKNKRFYFDPFEHSYDLLNKHYPISSMVMGNKVVVGVVWNDNLKGDVAVGDQILKIDSINYEFSDPCDLLSKSSPLKDRDSAKIVIKNHYGIVKTFVIKKE